MIPKVSLLGFFTLNSRETKNSRMQGSLQDTLTELFKGFKVKKNSDLMGEGDRLS